MTTPGETDFSIHNLPFGVFETEAGGPRAGIAIGTQIVDLAQLAAQGYFKDLNIPDLSVFSRDSLNEFIALGKPYWRAVRQRVTTFLASKAVARSWRNNSAGIVTTSFPSLSSSCLIRTFNREYCIVRAPACDQN